MPPHALLKFHHYKDEPRGRDYTHDFKTTLWHVIVSFPRGTASRQILWSGILWTGGDIQT